MVRQTPLVYRERDSMSFGSRSWSNRILLAALTGILFLTLFPFRFDSHPKVSGLASALLFQGSVKYGGHLDIFLNILLFAPFGFGLSAKLIERGKSKLTTAITVFAAGVLLSYTIEFLQLFIPSRDSGWEDVFTNSTGAFAGFVVFTQSAAVVSWLSRFERQFEMWACHTQIAWSFAVYFAIWFLVSIHLQQETRLHWEPYCSLLIGSQVAGQPTPKQVISRLEFWDHALPNSLARRISSGENPGAFENTPSASYQLTGAAPYLDQRLLLPELVARYHLPRGYRQAAILEPTPWLTSKDPVTSLVTRIDNANQFSVRVVWTPADTRNIESSIVLLSDPSGTDDLTIRQSNTDLVFWFRNPISARSQIAWRIPLVFDSAKARDILYSYNGADLALWIDGKQQPDTYQLGPGTALARLVRRIKTSELPGYKYIYYALVFAPGGFLLGIAARYIRQPALRATLPWGLGILLPPLVMEFILVRISHRPFSTANLVLSVFLAVGGSIWINLDTYPDVNEYSSDT
jgi:glycopeptide antibiotics resistance protein